MPKAVINLPTGAHVTIEGTTEEIQTFLDLYAKRDKRSSRGRSATKKRASAGSKRTLKGPLGHILELKEEGFFRTKRSLGAVRDKLSEKGHIYPPSSLSPAMIRLTRGEKLRRLKEGTTWVYVSK